MPVSPAVSEPYATTYDGEPRKGSISEEYEALVVALLLMLVAALAVPSPSIPWPASWPDMAMSRLPRFRRDVDARLAVVLSRVTGLSVSAMRDVIGVGHREAVVDARLGDVPVGVSHVVASRGLVEALSSVHARVSSVLTGVFRRVVNEVRVAHGDPRPVVERILNDLANRGIDGYVDAAGRHWSLEHYVETTVRWHLAQAAMGEYVHVLRSSNVRFVRVGSAYTTHGVCNEWAGKYISLDGSPKGDYVVNVNGRERTVNVYGTYEQAWAAGLWHPHCRHPVEYSPMLRSRTSRASTSAGHVERAEARHRRRIARAWDRRTKVALTRQGEVEASRRSRAWRRMTGDRPSREA